jgi:solute:Na+ symporter, SSS family
MNWFVFWIVVYLAILIYFTLKHVKYNDIDGYLINNRKTSTFALVFTTLATFVGGGVCMGLIAMGYTSGFAAVAVGLAYVIGFFILFFFAGKIRTIGASKNIYSFAEFLNRSYIKETENSNFPKIFAGLISGVNIVIFFFLTAAQFVGMATLLSYAFGVGYVYAAGISFLIVIIYTALAGLSGVIITDIIQFSVICFMIVFVFIPGIWIESSGFERLVELPTSFLNGTHEGLIFLIALPLMLSPSILTRMDIWQRILAAGSEKIAKKTALISGFSMLPFYIIFPLVGMVVRINLGEDIDPNHAMHLFLEKSTSNVLLGFSIIGLLAALMSSADSFLNIVAITAIRDFSSWKNNANSKVLHFKRIRIAVVIFGAMALAMALYFANIVELFIAGITLNIVFAPVCLFALLKKDVHKYKFAAFYSILSGIIVIAFLFLLGFVTMQPKILMIAFVPATLVSSVVLFIGVYGLRMYGVKS